MSDRPRLYRRVPIVNRDPWAADFIDSGGYDELLRIVDRPAWEQKMARSDAPLVNEDEPSRQAP